MTIWQIFQAVISVGVFIFGCLIWLKVVPLSEEDIILWLGLCVMSVGSFMLGKAIEK